MTRTPAPARCDNPECPHDRALVLVDTDPAGDAADRCATCRRLLVVEPQPEVAGV